MITNSRTARLSATAFVLATIPIYVEAGFPGNVVEAVGKGVREVGKGAEKLNEEATKVTTKANTELTNGAKEANTTVTKGAEKLNEEGTKLTTKANTELTNGAKDVNTTVTKGAAKFNEEATKGLEVVNSTVTDGIQHAAEQAKELNKNVKWNLEKAGRDTEAETARFGRNLEDAAHAIGHFVERQVQGGGKTLSNAERRLREGKVVDAVWHLATEPLQHTSDNAAQAAQESAYLNTVAQVAATAYGGPQGAAAYAAWLTYAQTGNADLALRAGILTYATSSAFAAAKGMPSDTTSQLAQKAAVTASIGGLAVAAAGGDPAAIKEGFLQAGAMVLVQDGYKQVTGSDIDGRASEGEAYCMTAMGEECSPPDAAYVRDSDGNIVKNSKGDPLIDMSKVDARRPHVGTMGGVTPSSMAEERGAVMTSISRIPGMNAMAVFHDQWTISWAMDPVPTVATIVPAIVLTYTGTGVNYYEHLRTTTIKSGEAAVTGVQPMIVPTVSLPAGTSSTPNVAMTDVGKSEFNTSSAILSVTCVDGDKERTLVVDVPSGGQSCRVVSIGAEGATVLTTSEKAESCIATVQKSVTNSHATQSCFSRNTANLLGNREPPPQVREAVNSVQDNVLPSFSNSEVGSIFLSVLGFIFALLGYGARDFQHRVTVKRAKRDNAVGSQDKSLDQVRPGNI